MQYIERGGDSRKGEREGRREGDTRRKIGRKERGAIFYSR